MPICYLAAGGFKVIDCFSPASCGSTSCIKPTRFYAGQSEVKELEKFATLLTQNIGQMWLASMFYPLAIMHGCPKRRQSPR